MAISALFKTAYLQHMVLIDAKSAEALTVNVGDLVTVKSDGTVAAISDPASEVDLSSPPAGNRYAIIAQTDISLASVDNGSSVKRAGPYAHVPVEEKDLRFDSTLKLSTTAKKISVFWVTDPNDVVLKDYTAASGGGLPEQLV